MSTAAEFWALLGVAAPPAPDPASEAQARAILESFWGPRAKVKDFTLAPGPAEPAPQVSWGRVVRRSDDFDRIDGLHRVVADPLTDAVRAWAAELRRPEGSMELRPVQIRALWAAHVLEGLFAPIGVGRGKTLITLLLPTVLDSQRAVLLTQPAIVPQLRRDLAELARHWRIRTEAITIVPYSKLSVASGANLLDELAPDLVIADEAHALRHPSAARTKRFLRYFKAHPETRFCALSGTITARSLRDYAHLATLALRDGAPVPREPRALDEWARALDEGVPDAERYEPGVLAQWCKYGESVRAGYQRRMVQTPGVVATVDSTVPNGLEITARGLKAPRIAQALRDLYRTECTPDGIELADAKEIARVARQLACGFWYRWVWPDGHPDETWLEARNAWNRYARRALAREAPVGLDSPLLVARAAVRGDLGPGARGLWDAWAAVKDRAEPPVEAVWIDSSLIFDVIDWTQGGAEPAIVWTEHRAILERLLTGLPTYGAGEDASTADPAREPRIVCSIAAQGTGKNLQRYSRNLITTPPASGAAWEQLLGRTHREGQTADVVTVDVYAHAQCFQDAVAQAKADAWYIAETTGQPQKLQLATWIGW